MGVLLSKPKRIKILVGGRASTKSTFVADYVVSQISNGRTWCCSREYQNSIDESVHQFLLDEIQRLDFPGFLPLKTEINHVSGGKAFYRGLARNITSLKGIICDGLWIEEGEATSSQTLTVLTASIRISAKQQAEEEINIPEIWVTMNRGSSKDPIASKFLKRAEPSLTECGYYEDDLMMVIDVNYDENPWFIGSGLEVERADDEKHLSRAAYEHKWLGAYSDTIENAIIETDWFDACIGAHEVLGFKPEGVEVVAHDPFDGGNDAGAYAHLHGSVFVGAGLTKQGRVNDACEWALDYVQKVKPELFIWDSGGVGAGLKKQVTDAIGSKKIAVKMFEGQARTDKPDVAYMPTKNMMEKEKLNKEMFLNRRAQMYWRLRDRMYNTYLAVQEGKYTDPSDLISIDKDIEHLGIIRAELCRIPRKPNGAGKIQILSKPEMKAIGIDSPNLGDCFMMAMDNDINTGTEVNINFSGWGE